MRYPVAPLGLYSVTDLVGLLQGLKKLHQATPVAMVIIAQPAYVPASMLQQGNNVAQQLIQYFQNVHNFPK